MKFDSWPLQNDLQPNICHPLVTFHKPSIPYQDEGSHLEQVILKAQKAVKHYYQTIPTPKFYSSPKADQKLMFRDIISLTGYFDLNKNGSEFRNIWMKLYDYGQT